MRRVSSTGRAVVTFRAHRWVINQWAGLAVETFSTLVHCTVSHQLCKHAILTTLSRDIYNIITWYNKYLQLKITLLSKTCPISALLTVRAVVSVRTLLRCNALFRTIIPRLTWSWTYSLSCFLYLNTIVRWLPWYLTWTQKSLHGYYQQLLRNETQWVIEWINLLYLQHFNDIKHGSKYLLYSSVEGIKTLLLAFQLKISQ